MAYPRLDPSGMDFTVTKYNQMIDMLEYLGSNVIGRAVVSGLEISASTGLNISVSDGMLSSRSVVSLSGLAEFGCPSNQTVYIWCDETGTLSSTLSPSYPGGNVVCLGSVVTDGSGVTEVRYTGRQALGGSLQERSQISGYVAVPVASTNLTLDPDQYRNQIIEFTGTLTANVVVTLPLEAGRTWTLWDSTVAGAFEVRVKTPGGSESALVNGQGGIYFSDGTNIRKATP